MKLIAVVMTSSRMGREVVCAVAELPTRLPEAGPRPRVMLTFELQCPLLPFQNIPAPGPISF